jgi:diguanylate cyclase (GGDEF)-like protein/PAS domain S-box-containing protein
MDFKLIDRILALGNLIGYAGIAYIEADNCLQVSSWNKGAADLFGYSEYETMGCFLYELIPLEKDKLVKCRRTRRETVTYIAGSGQKLHCEILYTPIMTTKGEKLGIAVLARDISEELQLKKNLKQQKQHLSDIFDFAPIGIYHVNMEGSVTSANSEYAWMLGYESSRAVVEQVGDFAGQTFFEPEKAEEFMFAIYEAEEVSRFRCQIKRKDGSYVWGLCYAKATYDESGRMNGFNGFTIDISETVRAELELKKANGKLQMLSVIDGLTQIPNRRRFDEYLEAEWQRLCREQKPIALIMCDIDFFKLYNDNYGHQAGDECLKKVAGAISTTACRSTDLAARYGGEEFVVVLPGTDLDGAMIIAERIRNNVNELKIIHEKSNVNDYVTLSLGVAAVIPGHDHIAEDLIVRADQALYEAKESGRNRFVATAGISD